MQLTSFRFGFVHLSAEEGGRRASDGTAAEGGPRQSGLVQRMWRSAGRVGRRVCYRSGSDGKKEKTEKRGRRATVAEEK